MNTSTVSNRTILGLALIGALGITFDQWLDVMDQWGQPGWAAKYKRLYGDTRYYLDGTRVGEEKNDRTGQLTLTATQLGRLACAVHVALQSGAHVAVSVAITRLVGYRIPLPAVLAGTAINGIVHFLFDRGDTLEALALLLDKDDYLQDFTVVRKEGKPALKFARDAAHAALAETMTVTVRDRAAEAPWGSGPTSPRIRTVTISAFCSVCGGHRGEPAGINQHDDGAWYWVQVWDNPCGHTDYYDRVITEAHALQLAATAVTR